jgi:hypothetical protein
LTETSFWQELILMDDAATYGNDSVAETGRQDSASAHRRDFPSLPLFNQPLLLDRPIAFHRCLVTMAGSVTAALMLSQALYWQKRCPHDDGWWWKTMENWTEETGLSRREQENARRRLRNAGLLSEELRGVPATLHFHVDLNAVNRRLQGVDAEPVDVTGKGQTSLPQTGNPVCTKGTNKIAPNGQTRLPQTGKLLSMILRLLLRLQQRPPQPPRRWPNRRRPPGRIVVVVVVN